MKKMIFPQWGKGKKAERRGSPNNQLSNSKNKSMADQQCFDSINGHRDRG